MGQIGVNKQRWKVIKQIELLRKAIRCEIDGTDSVEAWKEFEKFSLQHMKIGKETNESRSDSNEGSENKAGSEPDVRV